MPSKVRLETFFEKIKNVGPKIHYFALKWASKLYSGASKSGLGEPGGPAPLDPLVKNNVYHDIF